MAVVRSKADLEKYKEDDLPDVQCPICKRVWMTFCSKIPLILEKGCEICRKDEEGKSDIYKKTHCEITYPNGMKEKKEAE